MTDWEDTKLIECANCLAPLNGKPLFIQLDENNLPKMLCVACAPIPSEGVMSEDPVCNAANKAGNKFVQETQHVCLLETENAEVMIRNMRFMAYSSGFQDGVEWQIARKTDEAE